jgi:hypothetical protein
LLTALTQEEEPEPEEEEEEEEELEEVEDEEDEVTEEPDPAPEEDTEETETPEEENNEEPENDEPLNEIEKEALSVEAIHDSADGTEITVFGVVTLPPGILGKTIFSIQDSNTRYGATVRIYGDTIPEISEGDLVQVEGKVNHNDDGEVRINSSAKKITTTGTTQTQIWQETPGSLDGQMTGLAVTIEGTVSDMGDSWFMLTDTDATEEVKVNLPDSLSHQLTSGNSVRVTGVVTSGDPATVVIYDSTGLESILEQSVEETETETEETPESTTDSTEEDSADGILPFLTVGAIGAGGVAVRSLRGRGKQA